MSRPRRRHAAGGWGLLALLGVGLAACGGGGSGPPAPAGPFRLVDGPLARLTRLRDLGAAEAGVPVEATALSPDGGLVAVGDALGRVSLFEAATGLRRFVVTLPPPDARWVGTPSEGYAHGLGRRVVGLAILAATPQVLAVNGLGTVVRLALADGSASAPVALPVAVAALSVDEPGDRLVVGTDRGAVEEFALSTLAPTRTYRPADDAGLAHFVRHGPAGATLLTALSDYDPLADAEGGGPGPGVSNAGLTRWSTATGLRDLRLGGPPGTASAFEAPGPAAPIVAGTMEGHGVLFDATGVPLAEAAPFFQRVAPVAAGAETLAVAATPLRVCLVRLADRAVVAQSRDPLHPSPLVPRSLSSAAAAGRFALGHQDGSAAVFEVELLPAPIAPGFVARDQPLGSALGASLRVSGELVAHAARVEEVAVSPSGRFVGTRDASGQVYFWDTAAFGAPAAAKPARPAAAPRLVAGPLLVGQCPAGGTRIRFDAAEATALVLVSPAELARVALPAGTVLATVAPQQGGSPLAVCAALDVGPGAMLVADEDGGLYACDGAGAVVQVLVPAVAPVDEAALGVPFGTLMHWPDGQRILAAPTEVDPALGTTQRITFVDRATGQPVSVSNHAYLGGAFAPFDGGGALVLAERSEGRGLSVLADGPTWPVVATASRLAPRHGPAGVGGGLLLGADHDRVVLIRVQGGQFLTGALPHAGGAAASAFGGSAASAQAFLGLSNGRVLRLQAE